MVWEAYKKFREGNRFERVFFPEQKGMYESEVCIMEVKEYLGQAKHLNLLLDAKLDQIRKLKSQEEKAAITLNDVNEKANTLRRFKQMEEKLQGEIDDLLDLKMEIMDTISLVEDDECRLILEKRFLNGQKYCDIAKDMYMSEKSVYRIQDKAFKDEILKKIVESKNKMTVNGME